MSKREIWKPKLDENSPDVYGERDRDEFMLHLQKTYTDTIYPGLIPKHKEGDRLKDLNALKNFISEITACKKLVELEEEFVEKTLDYETLSDLSGDSDKILKKIYKDFIKNSDNNFKVGIYILLLMKRYDIWDPDFKKKFQNTPIKSISGSVSVFNFDTNDVKEFLGSSRSTSPTSITREPSSGYQGKKWGTVKTPSGLSQGYGSHSNYGGKKTRKNKKPKKKTKRKVRRGKRTRRR